MIFFSANNYVYFAVLLVVDRGIFSWSYCEFLYFFMRCKTSTLMILAVQGIIKNILKSMLQYVLHISNSSDQLHVVSVLYSRKLNTLDRSSRVTVLENLSKYLPLPGNNFWPAQFCIWCHENVAVIIYATSDIFICFFSGLSLSILRMPRV